MEGSHWGPAPPEVIGTEDFTPPSAALSRLELHQLLEQAQAPLEDSPRRSPAPLFGDCSRSTSKRELQRRTAHLASRRAAAAQLLDHLEREVQIVNAEFAERDRQQQLEQQQARSAWFVACASACCDKEDAEVISLKPVSSSKASHGIHQPVELRSTLRKRLRETQEQLRRKDMELMRLKGVLPPVDAGAAPVASASPSTCTSTTASGSNSARSDDQGSWGVHGFPTPRQVAFVSEIPSIVATQVSPKLAFPLGTPRPPSELVALRRPAPPGTIGSERLVHGACTTLGLEALVVLEGVVFSAWRTAVVRERMYVSYRGCAVGREANSSPDSPRGERRVDADGDPVPLEMHSRRREREVPNIPAWQVIKEWETMTPVFLPPPPLSSRQQEASFTPANSYCLGECSFQEQRREQASFSPANSFGERSFQEQRREQASFSPANSFGERSFQEEPRSEEPRSEEPRSEEPRSEVWPAPAMRGPSDAPPAAGTDIPEAPRRPTSRHLSFLHSARPPVGAPVKRAASSWSPKRWSRAPASQGNAEATPLAEARLSTQPQVLLQPGQEFVVTLEKATKKDTIGLDIKQRKGADYLCISGVKEAGLMNKWNLSHPAHRVEKGDLIVMANGCRGQRDILREVGTEMALTMRLVKQGDPDVAYT